MAAGTAGNLAGAVGGGSGASSCALRGGAALRGRLKPPGDKSISHRALLLAALANGTSRLTGLANGQDVIHTAQALRDMGVQIDWPLGDAAAGMEAVVQGGGLSQPQDVLYVGNSGTSFRLLAGVCASLPIAVTLDGDASLRSRPMNRIAEPLRHMGASIAPATAAESAPAPATAPTAAPSELTAPLTIQGGQLQGLDYTLPVASAQVKGAVLLAGLGASGATVVREQAPTRSHTEEMLAEWGASITVVEAAGKAAGEVAGKAAGEAASYARHITLEPSQLTARDYEVPGDPSQGAFWIVAAVCVPGSDVAIENVYLGPGRAGFVAVLERMGAQLQICGASSDVAASAAAAESAASPATLQAAASELVGTDVLAEEAPGLIDEIPILAVAAAHASGTTRFLGVQELRAKESDRLSTIAEFINSLGGCAAIEADALIIQGTGGLQAGQVDSHGDHRIAMAAAVAALASSGETTIENWGCVATSYPDFLTDLNRLLTTEPS